MSSIDVRGNVEKIRKIIFAESDDSRTGFTQAYYIQPFDEIKENVIIICDEDYDGDVDRGAVLLTSKKDGLNLIKAIEKSIELGWIK